MTLLEKAVLDPKARLGRLRGTAERQLREAFLQTVARLRSQPSLRALTELIAQGRLAEAFAEVTNTDRLARAWARAYERAARSTGNALGQEFALQGRAQRTLDAQALRILSEFSASQREATRAVLVRGLQANLSPTEMARAFRDSMGLTLPQTQAIANYRATLERGSVQALNRELRDRRFDPTVRRAEPLTASQIDTMVERYRERNIAFRADAIATTEALRSTGMGDEEAKLQLLEAGVLVAAQIQQTWHTRGDHRVRGSHTSMSGQVRAFGEPFTSGRGYALLYPGDFNAPASESIHCRCFLETTILSPAEAAGLVSR